MRSNPSQQFNAKPNIDAGISTLSRQEWISICVFFNAAVYDNPTTETKMRLRLGMTKEDEFKKDFADLSLLFAELAEHGQEFQTKVRKEALTLADDIVHYQVTSDSVFKRLQELVDKYDFDGPGGIQGKLNELLKVWGSGKVSGRSDKIKTRIRDAVKRLADEAEQRAQRADVLHKVIIGKNGLQQKVLKSKSKFDDMKRIVDQAYGEKSKEVERLNKLIEDINIELKSLRKKEKDEVIVLATSPLYLIIPFIGPLILAGVDIGVGVDLAKTREKINAKLEEYDVATQRLGVKTKFKCQYGSGQKMTDGIIRDIERVAPQLEKLGLGWRAMASDLNAIVTVLSKDGAVQVQDLDWSNLIVSLDTARTTWKAVAARADHFRQVAVPLKVETREELLKPLSKEAAVA